MAACNSVWAGDIQLFGPIPYKSVADTPDGFLCGADGSVWFLEDFEDNARDPRIRFEGGMIVPPGYDSGLPNVTDSVDGDDGFIDGTGQTGDKGYSWFNVGQVVLMSFDRLVTSAGIVWTDGDRLLTNVIFEAFDQDMNSLGTIDAGDLSDDSYQGTTDEDRFFGAVFGDGIATGIKALKLTNAGGGTGVEVDHVQFEICAAPVVPEPAGVLLIGMGLVAASPLLDQLRRTGRRAVGAA
jgi:hypothetical protein